MFKMKFSTGQTVILNLETWGQNSYGSSSLCCFLASCSLLITFWNLLFLSRKLMMICIYSKVELTKMKESCDSFVRNIDREERQTVISSEECDTFSMKPVTTYPTDHDPGPKSILKNKTASNFVARESSFEKTPLHQENPCTEQEMIWDNETRQYVHSMRRTDINRIYYNSWEL